MGESDAELWRLRKFAPQNWQESVAGARKEKVPAPLRAAGRRGFSRRGAEAG